MQAELESVVLAGAAGQDRLAVLPVESGHVLVVADGAGGVSGGGEAADEVINAVREAASSGDRRWAEVLSQVDGRLAGAGLSTAVVVEVRGDTIFGASVGDSGAELYTAGARHDLTAGQNRKPLLGSGHARPVSFSRVLGGPATLVVATDGLWRFTTVETIADQLETSPLDQACDALVEGVRLPSGNLSDDIAIIVCRLSPEP